MLKNVTPEQIEMLKKHEEFHKLIAAWYVYPTPKTLKEAMKELPEGYRVVLSLYLLEGYDHEEIGQILNISENTSRTQFLRAKRKLNEILTRRGISS